MQRITNTDNQSLLQIKRISAQVHEYQLDAAGGERRELLQIKRSLKSFISPGDT